MSAPTVGDVVRLRPDVEMHRPPRRHRVLAVNQQGICLAVLAEDLCSCRYCDSVREGGNTGGWYGISVVDQPDPQMSIFDVLEPDPVELQRAVDAADYALCEFCIGDGQILTSDSWRGCGHCGGTGERQAS